MRSSYDAYEQVAENCSRFNSYSKDSYSNSYSDGREVSCINCKHFDEDKFCKLDLYDPIVKNHHIDV